MENQELLEKENQIPGEENTQVTEEVGAETGAAEDGVSNEAAVEDKPVEENVASGDGVESGGVIEDGVEPENAEPVEAQELEPELDSADSEAIGNEQAEKMLTQSQVNELVGKARAEGRASAMKELYERYGVSDDNEMNDVFGKGQGYDLLSDEYNTLDGNYKSVAAENALLKSGVIANRWDDVKAILGSKGMDITVENIQSEMATHPEWQNSSSVVAENESGNKELSPETLEAMSENTKPGKQAQVQPSTIRKLGSNVPENNTDTEEQNALKMFGM